MQLVLQIHDASLCTSYKVQINASPMKEANFLFRRIKLHLICKGFFFARSKCLRSGIFVSCYLSPASVNKEGILTIYVHFIFHSYLREVFPGPV